MNIQEALVWASQSIRSESPRLDAEVLLAEALQRNRTYLYTWPERPVPEDALIKWQHWVERRVTGEPIAHILGHREFWSLSFEVSPDTLIPRPDTEVLVEALLSRLKPDLAVDILDLGTGTGAIAMALAKELPNASILAVDFRPEVVQLAERNRQRLGCHNVEVRLSNWFDCIQRPVDWIVSNPPYIDVRDEHLSQGDVRFEPQSALVAEQDGLADLQHIVQRAPEFLRPGGGILLEHGWQQADVVQSMLQSAGFLGVQTLLDYAGHPRVTGGDWA